MGAVDIRDSPHFYANTLLLPFQIAFQIAKSRC